MAEERGRVMMKMLLVLWIGVIMGFVIGRWNRGNDLDIQVTLADAIRWIEEHGETNMEKSRMIDLLIYLTDGKENGENE